MKKNIITILMLPMSLCAVAQMSELDGVKIMEDSYAHKISHSGKWVVMEAMGVEGSTVVYNTSEGTYQYYEGSDFGRGYVVADDGTTVGCQLRGNYEGEAVTVAVLMKNGENTFSPVFDSFSSSNIHSITPDGSRICGVVAKAGSSSSYLPFYCDIDGMGSLSEVKYLPTPDKDCFGTRPQYCSATWMSEDGKTIAGQVIDSHGFFVYPILYKQNESGEWSYSFPAQNKFNPQNRPIPEPLGDIEQVFPDAPYPEIRDFMSALKYAQFEADGTPYDELEKYMGEENYEKYLIAEEKYLIAQEQYEVMFENYMNTLWQIADESLFFVRNAMALSADGKFLASSAHVYQQVDIMNMNEYYVPYVCNLETGEWTRITPNNQYVLITNQILPGGNVVCANPGGNIPASSYIYFYDQKEFVSLYNYVKDVNPAYGEWYDRNLTGEVLVGEETNGDYIFSDMTVTGLAAISDDMSVIAAGTDGYVFQMGLYFTYFLTNLSAGVESIVDDTVDEVYTVYNTQGVKVLQTKNRFELNNLAKGLYIINGKKILINK